jgi:hypothetical protein
MRGAVVELVRGGAGWLLLALGGAWPGRAEGEGDQREGPGGPGGAALVSWSRTWGEARARLERSCSSWGWRRAHGASAAARWACAGARWAWWRGSPGGLGSGV